MNKSKVSKLYFVLKQKAKRLKMLISKKNRNEITYFQLIMINSVLLACLFLLKNYFQILWKV